MEEVGIEKPLGGDLPVSCTQHKSGKRQVPASVQCQSAWASLLAVFLTSEIAWKQDTMLARLSDGLLGLFCILVLVQV